METVLTCLWSIDRTRHFKKNRAINRSVLSSASVPSASHRKSLWILSVDTNLCTRWVFMIISFPNSWWYFSISSRWLFQFKKNEPALVTCITNWPSRSSFFRQSAFAKRWIASIGILFFLIRVSLASQWITRSSCPLVLGRKLMTTMLVGDSLKNVCSNANTHHPLKFLIFFMFPCSHLGSVN